MQAGYDDCGTVQLIPDIQKDKQESNSIHMAAHTCTSLHRNAHRQWGGVGAILNYWTAAFAVRDSRVLVGYAPLDKY